MQQRRFRPLPHTFRRRPHSSRATLSSVYCAYFELSPSQILTIVKLNSNYPMKKSSSLHTYKLDFNLKQCLIGQSSIDRLPLKLEARRYSASHLPRPLLTQQKLQLQHLKNQNLVLKKQNERLRRELQSQKVPRGRLNTETKLSEYRDKIRSKLSSKVKCSRETECDEALMTTKEGSQEQINLTITDWFEQYNLAQKLPTLGDLQHVAEKFFREYCCSYAKLKSLFECLQGSKLSQEYKRLSELIQLYKMPLLYQRSPQTLFRELHNSKEKNKISLNQKEQVCWQTLSPHETLARFQTLLAKLCRSGQMLRALKGNETVLKFIKKVQEKN